MQISVADNPTASRFEVFADGAQAGHLDYTLTDGVYRLPHTWTDPALRGRGLATQLVLGALDEIATRGGTVFPTCGFVQDVIAGHPEYQSLVDGEVPAAYCPWRPST